MSEKKSAIEKCIDYMKEWGEYADYCDGKDNKEYFADAEHELAELIAIKNRVFNDKDCRYCKNKNIPISRKPCNECTGLSENWEYDA